MVKFICKYCLENFKSSSLLLKHQRSDKTCINYRDIIFFCERCNLSIKGIKNIDKHIKTNSCCETASVISDDLNEYIFDDSDDEIDKQTIEEDLSLQKRIIKLENELKVEKIKNNTLLDVINKIKNDIYIEPQIHTENKLKIDTIIESKRETNELILENDIEPENDTKKAFKIFKSSQIEMIEEIDKQLIDDHIKTIDHKRYCIKQNFGNLERYNMLFKQEVDALKEVRVNANNKNLENIKNIRRSIIGSMPIDDYINLLNENNKVLFNLLEAKGHQAKKIPGFIFKTLSTLDMRLLHYENYYDVTLDVDEYSRFKVSLELFTKSFSYYSPFIFDDFIKFFFNYGTVLTPLKTCIEFYLFNPYGFNNVIYVPLKQSSDEDSYSFYILDSVEKGKRYWKMDCRLFELVENIVSSLTPFFVNIFRKMYQNVYKDNDFREDYYKVTLLNTDANQLLMNLVFLNNKKQLCNYLREIVKEKATHIPTPNDKFYLHADDAIIRKKASKNKETDMVDLIKSLFDTITGEQAVDLYRGKN